MCSDVKLLNNNSVWKNLRAIAEERPSWPVCNNELHVAHQRCAKHDADKVGAVCVHTVSSFWFNAETIVRMVVIFAEGLFDGESYVQ